MKYITLGKTGLDVSKLCFGTLPFSPLLAYSKGAEFATEVLLRSFELGVNFIDTAELYSNYDMLAPALRQSPDVIVASKTYAYTASAAISAVEAARQALGRDVIDIFLLHEQVGEHTLRGHAPALEALYGLKSKRIIRAVGLSTHHVSGVRAAIDAKLDVIHPLVNIDGIGIPDGSRGEMEAAICDAMSAGIGVYLMKVLGGGSLHHRAAEALSYANDIGHCFSLGMRDILEVEAAVEFIGIGTLNPLPEIVKREVYISDWCSGCGKCAAKCASGAITIKRGKAVVAHDKCVLCGYCGKYCESFCLKIK